MAPQLPKRRIVALHATLAGVLFYCMITALHWPIIGHPSWWQFPWAAQLGTSIGKIPYEFGLWVAKLIPGLLAEPFAWLVAGIWALFLSSPILLLLRYRSIVPIRTLGLLIALAFSVRYRLDTPPRPLRAFPVHPIEQWELNTAKRSLLDWDFQHLKHQAKPSQPRNSVSLPDPRTALNFLWDELSVEERKKLLIALGFDPNTTAYQLVHGPQPRFFLDSGVDWYPCDLLPVEG